MEKQGSRKLSSRKYAYAFFTISLLSGLVCALIFQLGLFVIPVTAAALGALFLAERGGRRILSYIAPAVLVLLDLAFNSVYSLNCFASVLLALIIYLCFIKSRDKSECAVYSTLLISLFTLVSFILSAFFITESFSLDTAATFYTEQFESIKNEFISIFRELSAEGDGGSVLLSEEDIALMFVSVYNSLTAFIAIFSFALSGIALKIFSAIVSTFHEMGKSKELWSFRTSNLFAYTYYALVILSFFVLGNTIFGVAVINLYSIFMIVYAYLGYKFLSSMLCVSLSRPALAKAIVIIATVLFSALAVQLLSFIGAFMTVMSNKRSSLHGSGENNV